MEKHEEIPMVESLMALTFHPSEYLDLPVSVVKERLNRQSVRRLLKNINLSSVDPVFVLEGEQDELDLTLGPNTLGVSTVNAYHDWPSFKTRGVATLRKGIKPFNTRTLQMGLLRYVDILKPGQLRAASPQIQIQGTNPEKWTFLNKGESQRSNWFVECEFRGDDAIVFLTTATAIDSFADFEEWLNEAHDLQKRLLWDVVSEPLHRSKLFDDAERQSFATGD